MERVVISADSHVMEPADLWTSRVDASLRDLAPRGAHRTRAGPGTRSTRPALPPSTVSGSWGAGRSGAELKEHLETRGLRVGPPVGLGPGRAAEGPGRRRRARRGAVRHARHAPLPHDRRASCSRSSSASTTTGSPSSARTRPQRLHGLGLISLWDVDAGVRELERCAELGHKGAMIWGYPPRRRAVLLARLRPACGRPRRTSSSRCRCTSSPAWATRAGSTSPPPRCATRS